MFWQATILTIRNKESEVLLFAYKRFVVEGIACARTHTMMQRCIHDDINHHKQNLSISIVIPIELRGNVHIVDVRLFMILFDVYNNDGGGGGDDGDGERSGRGWMWKTVTFSVVNIFIHSFWIA